MTIFKFQENLIIRKFGISVVYYLKSLGLYKFEYVTFLLYGYEIEVFLKQFID